MTTVACKNGTIIASTDPDNVYALIRTPFGWKYLHNSAEAKQRGGYSRGGDEYAAQQIKAGREKVIFHPDRVV